MIPHKMELNLPWSDWFVTQGKKRKKVDPWMMVDISMEEQFNLELVMRSVYDCLDPDEIMDFVSALALDHYRLVKAVNQAGNYIDKNVKKT